MKIATILSYREIKKIRILLALMVCIKFSDLLIGYSFIVLQTFWISPLHTTPWNTVWAVNLKFLKEKQRELMDMMSFPYIISMPELWTECIGKPTPHKIHLLATLRVQKAKPYLDRRIWKDVRAVRTINCPEMSNVLFLSLPNLFCWMWYKSGTKASWQRSKEEP